MFCDFENSDGDSPVNIALREKKDFGLVDCLIKSQLSFYSRNKKGRTSLHEAAKYSSFGTRVIKLLLEHGAPINAIDNEGSSALHDALKNPLVELEVIETLLKHGICPDFKDIRQFPPLAYVESSSLSSGDKISAAELLIKYSVLHKFKDSYYRKLNPRDLMKKREEIFCIHFCMDESRKREWAVYRDYCITEIIWMTAEGTAPDNTYLDIVLKYLEPNGRLDFLVLHPGAFLEGLNHFVCYRDLLLYSFRVIR